MSDKVNKSLKERLEILEYGERRGDERKRENKLDSIESLGASCKGEDTVKEFISTGCQ